MERVRRIVRNCGKLFSQQESIAGLTTELTPAEAQSPFAKYYHQGVKPMEPEQARAFAPHCAMDPKEAFLPWQYREYMRHPGYNAVENGYCVLPNGASYTAIHTLQPGLTDEMIRNFNADFAPDPDLFYKIWFPGAHLRHMADGAIEDVGWGMLELHFVAAMSEEVLGLQDLQALDPSAIYMDGCYARGLPPGASAGTEPVHVVLINEYRDIPGGREIRHRFWTGIAWDDGQWRLALRPGERMPEEYARLLGVHCAGEYGTETRNTLAFWRENH